MITGFLFENDPFDDIRQYDDSEELGIVPKGNTGQWGCLKCGNTFNRKYAASRHYISHHMVTAPQTCSFCKKMYKNIESLQQHLRSVHGLTQADLKNRIVPRPKVE